jgi:hypothetical protein
LLVVAVLLLAAAVLPLAPGGGGARAAGPVRCPPALWSGAAPGLLTEAGIDANSYPFPRVGRLRALMLFADFADAPGDESPAAYFTRIGAPAEEWIGEASYGRLSLDIDHTGTWFRLPHPTGGYILQQYVDASLRLPLIHDAVEAADPAVDFSSYSLVFIVVPQSANLGSSPWVGVFPETGIRPDGNDRFNVALLGNDTRWTGSPALVYATLGLLGVPPLNVQARFGANPVGPWDAMSEEPPGAGPLAWHRWLLGWLDSKQLTCLPGVGSTTTALSPLEQPGGRKAVVIPTGRSAAYVVEARQPVGTDAGLCDQGVLVYSIDARRLPFSGPIRVISAHRGLPATDPAGARRCGALYNAPFDVGVGEVSRFHDVYHGITIMVLGLTRDGYAVRVTRVRARHPSPGG